MVPYPYDRWMPTAWLWVSEGITDYYADLALVRAGVIDSAEFLALTAGKMQEVADVPVVSLEDASISAWIGMSDGTGYIYYPKGSLAGFAARHPDPRGERQPPLARRRDARALPLDLREGQGVHRQGVVGRRVAGRGRGALRRLQRALRRRARTVPLRARCSRSPGFTPVVDSNRVARVGIQTNNDSTATIVQGVTPGGAFAVSGGQPGDQLVRVGDLDASTPSWAEQFRAKYGSAAEGTVIPVVVQRAGQPVTLQMPLRFVTLRSYRLVYDPKASPEAVRIRTGILAGMVNQ